jgi:hypothetical protein
MLRVLPLVRLFVDSPNIFPFFFICSAVASNPKHSKQRVEDNVVGDDIVTGRDVPSIIVDPMISGARATSGQTPTSASLRVDATACGVSLGQASLSASKKQS